MILQNLRKKLSGKYLSYYELTYRLADGSTKVYEMVSKKGTALNPEELTSENIGQGIAAVVLLVLNEDHSKMLVSKEFRLGVNGWVVNNVAGLVDEGEPVEQAAARELHEETGLTLTKIIKVLPSTFTCAPVIDDRTSLVICEAVGEITGSDSPVEAINSKWYTKEEMKKLLEDETVTFAGRAQAFAYMWAYNGRL